MDRNSSFIVCLANVRAVLVAVLVAVSGVALLTAAVGCQSKDLPIGEQTSGGGGTRAGTGGTTPGTSDAGVAGNVGGTAAGIAGVSGGGKPGDITGASGNGGAGTSVGPGGAVGSVGNLGSTGAGAMGGSAGGAPGGGLGALALVEAPRVDDDVAGAIVLGDIDNDGKPDLLVAKGMGVGVFSGSADFLSPTGVSYVAGSPVNASALALGEINGDHSLDLAVAGDASVSVFVNRGDGTFLAPTNYPFAAGTKIVGVALTDLTGDGKADLVVASNAPVAGQPDLAGSLSVFVNAGNGTFGLPSTTPAGTEARSLAIGELDGDGAVSVVIASQGAAGTGAVASGAGVFVYLNRGDATFSPVVSYATDKRPVSVALGDLDGDQHLELAFTNADSGDVSVLRNRGIGTFAPAVTYSDVNPTGGGAIAIGDLDGDGSADIATMVPGSFTIMVNGPGNGTFSDTDYLVEPMAPNTQSMAIADVNADGFLDFVHVGAGVTVESDPAASFFGEITATYSIALLDVNADGKPDLLTMSGAPGGQLNDRGSLTVWLGNGDGTFALGGTAYPALHLLGAGDLNGDGRPDLVIDHSLNAAAGTVAVGVLLNKGDGTYAPVVDTPGVPDNDLQIADLNGDGRADMVLGTGYKVDVLVNAGAGAFSPAVTYSTGNNPVGGESLTFQSLAVSDLDGDGKPDLVLGTEATCVSILLNKGNGTFAPAVCLSTVGLARVVAAADLDGDGKVDLIVGGSDSKSLTVFRNLGSGTFGPAVTYTTDPTSMISTGDLNGDGKVDVVFADGTGTRVLLNNGDGTLAPDGFFFDGTAGTLSDVNGDGKLDLVSINATNQRVQVLLNATP